jgi:hypothetical protein
LSATAVVSGNVPAPVRVRLKRLNCDHAIPYPPDGQAREWWQRLKNAFGTASSAFVDVSLQQLIAAARLPGSGISETAVNASLAFIEGCATYVSSQLFVLCDGERSAFGIMRTIPIAAALL